MENVGKILKSSNLIISGSKSKMSFLCEWNLKNERIIKKTFMEIGSELIARKYVVKEEHRDILTGMLKYFTGNECEYDLSKGIYLHGNFGVGKTILFQTIRKTLALLFPFSPNGFGITSIEQIIERFKKDNAYGTYGYNKEDMPINLCINEFGKKVNEKIYGTAAEQVVDSLFMIRYELFQSGRFTHVTSNYNPSVLTVPPIIQDRIKEMFNFIELTGESLR